MYKEALRRMRGLFRVPGDAAPAGPYCPPVDNEGNSTGGTAYGSFGWIRVGYYTACTWGNTTMAVKNY